MFTRGSAHRSAASGRDHLGSCGGWPPNRGVAPWGEPYEMAPPVGRGWARPGSERVVARGFAWVGRGFTGQGRVASPCAQFPAPLGRPGRPGRPETESTTPRTAPTRRSRRTTRSRAPGPTGPTESTTPRTAPTRRSRTSTQSRAPGPAGPTGSREHHPSDRTPAAKPQNDTGRRPPRRPCRRPGTGGCRLSRGWAAASQGRGELRETGRSPVRGCWGPSPPGCRGGAPRAVRPGGAGRVRAAGARCSA